MQFSIYYYINNFAPPSNDTLISSYGLVVAEQWSGGWLLVDAESVAGVEWRLASSILQVSIFNSMLTHDYSRLSIAASLPRFIT